MAWWRCMVPRMGLASLGEHQHGDSLRHMRHLVQTYIAQRKPRGRRLARQPATSRAPQRSRLAAPVAGVRRQAPRVAGLRTCRAPAGCRASSRECRVHACSPPAPG